MRHAALLLAVAVAGLTPAPAADAAPRFKRCGDTGTRCARLSVPLDRSGAVPGRVSLFVSRSAPFARGRARGAPLLFLAGGPGQSAALALIHESGGPILPGAERRELVVFDQRGTGRSGLLRCRRLERANLFKAGPAAGACARALGPRRAFYTTRDSVDDIEAVRRLIGTEQLAIFGVSYGSKVAMDYARTYPDRVERLVIDSVVEPGGPDPLYRPSVQAVPRVLRAACAGRCRWTEDPVADLAALVDRIAARGGIPGRVVSARGRARRTRLTRVDLFNVLLAGDFDDGMRNVFSGAVSAALDGDPAPMLRLRGRALDIDAQPSPPRVISSAVYAATSCEEAPLPWARTTPPDPAERHRQAAVIAASIPDSAFEPFDRESMLASDTLELCERWPHAPVARGPGPGPLPDVPVLLLNGEDDLRTPVESARKAAELFPRSRVVVPRATGHSAYGTDLSGCAYRAFANFLRDRPVAPRCPRGRRRTPQPPPPRRLGDVEPLAGTGGERGRTLRAVELTLADIDADVTSALIFDPSDPDFARGGGLRAGSYRIARRRFTLVLDEVSFVPGVTVSGRLRHFGESRRRGALRIGGGAAVHGRLRVTGRRVSGRLGGRRVAAVVDSAGSARAVAASRPSSLPR